MGSKWFTIIFERFTNILSGGKPISHHRSTIIIYSNSTFLGIKYKHLWLIMCFGPSDKGFGSKGRRFRGILKIWQCVGSERSLLIWVSTCRTRRGGTTRWPSRYAPLGGMVESLVPAADGVHSTRICGIGRRWRLHPAGTRSCRHIAWVVVVGASVPTGAASWATGFATGVTSAGLEPVK
jgi:hypothetical protein